MNMVGVDLNKLQSATIEQTYNLMRQSANALLLLHNLEIPHFDIKPTNMVYDTKKDLLKIVDMGNAFGSSNRKRFAATTENLKEKVTGFTPEFAPPEVLLMESSLIEELDVKLPLPGIDVYCWAMSFFAIVTNRSNIHLRNYVKSYKMRSEVDYKEFMKVVKDSFDSVKPKNSKEIELMKIVSDLLTRALEYKAEERPIIKDVIREMKKFEKEKKCILNYSNTELEHSKELLKLLKFDDDLDSYLNELLSKNKYKEEIKGESKVVDNSSDLLISLSCNHEISKNRLINYALNLFLYDKTYEYSYLCEVCKKVVELKYIPLYCGCKWTMFGEEIKFSNDLTKADYGKCSKGHPLTSIDLGLLNDFISDCPKEEKELVNSFNWIIKKERMEDIAWILRYTKAVTKLNLSGNEIGDKDTKVVKEAQ